MASSAHHAPPQHPRYPLSSMPQPSREREDVRLPSIKSLSLGLGGGGVSTRRHEVPENPSPYPSQVEVSASNQENSMRHSQSWNRAMPQAPSPSPISMQGYQHHQPPPPQHHHQQHHHHQQQHQQQQQQQHTPPLSASSHEPSHSHSKYDYPQKHDNGGFLTPGMPLSAQSTPVPGAVNSGPGTRIDDVSQAKRRRSSDNMHATGRDPRSPHASYHPYGYSSQPPPPPAPPQQNVYQTQAQPSLAPNSGQPGQPALDHINQVPPPSHPGYNGYQQYIPNRIPPQPHQSQIPHGNPYPSPGPQAVHQPPGPWEQPSQPQSHHPQHPPSVHPSQQHSQPPVHPPPQQPPSHHHHPQVQPPSVPQHHLQSVSHHHQPPAPQPVQPPPPPPQQQQQQQQQQHHNGALSSSQGYQTAYAPVHQSQPLPPQPQPQPLPQQPPPSQVQAQAQPQQQQQQPPQQMAFSRTSATPVQIDTRVQYPVPTDRAQDSTVAEIIQHCNALYAFANKYAHLQQQIPDACPTQQELLEMSHRAQEVVRLLEEYRRMNLPDAERVKLENAAVITPPDDVRPPKRPWEEISRGDDASEYPTPITDTNNRSTAEQDMETIRTKRATSTAGGAGTAGQPKSKYRKRSRATPPGKCHSCNIRETPEWRRGPDGARTLCNACGLHYAKLQRKREKMAGPEGEPPPIDLETLRASARAAEANKEANRAKGNRSQQNNQTASPSDPNKQLSHTGSFQLISVNPAAAAQETPSVTLSEPHRIPPPPPPHTQQIVQQPTGPLGGAPPPPWPTTAMGTGPMARGYPHAAAPEQLQHQSFMRTPHSIMNDSPR